MWCSDEDDEPRADEKQMNDSKGGGLGHKDSRELSVAHRGSDISHGSFSWSLDLILILQVQSDPVKHSFLKSPRVVFVV